MPNPESQYQCTGGSKCCYTKTLHMHASVNGIPMVIFLSENDEYFQLLKGTGDVGDDLAFKRGKPKPDYEESTETKGNDKGPVHKPTKISYEEIPKNIYEEIPKTIYKKPTKSSYIGSAKGSTPKPNKDSYDEPTEISQVQNRKEKTKKPFLKSEEITEAHKGKIKKDKKRSKETSFFQKNKKRSDISLERDSTTDIDKSTSIEYSYGKGSSKKFSRKSRKQTMKTMKSSESPKSYTGSPSSKGSQKSTKKTMKSSESPKSYTGSPSSKGSQKSRSVGKKNEFETVRSVSQSSQLSSHSANHNATISKSEEFIEDTDSISSRALMRDASTASEFTWVKKKENSKINKPESTDKWTYCEEPRVETKNASTSAGEPCKIEEKKPVCLKRPRPKTRDISTSADLPCTLEIEEKSISTSKVPSIESIHEIEEPESVEEIIEPVEEIVPEKEEMCIEEYKTRTEKIFARAPKRFKTKCGKGIKKKHREPKKKLKTPRKKEKGPKITKPKKATKKGRLRPSKIGEGRSVFVRCKKAQDGSKKKEKVKKEKVKKEKVKKVKVKKEKVKKVKVKKEKIKKEKVRFVEPIKQEKEETPKKEKPIKQRLKKEKKTAYKCYPVFKKKKKSNRYKNNNNDISQQKTYELIPVEQVNFVGIEDLSDKEELDLRRNSKMRYYIQGTPDDTSSSDETISNMPFKEPQHCISKTRSVFAPSLCSIWACSSNESKDILSAINANKNIQCSQERIIASTSDFSTSTTISTQTNFKEFEIFKKVSSPPSITMLTKNMKLLELNRDEGKTFSSRIISSDSEFI